MSWVSKLTRYVYKFRFFSHKLPDTNSLGICFLPDVVTRYNVKSSMRNTTQALINFAKLSSVVLCCCACVIWLANAEALPTEPPALLPGRCGVFAPEPAGGVLPTVGACAKLRACSAFTLSATGEGGAVRSSGACVDGRFGWLRLSTASRNVLSDSLSHNAGDTDASRYL